MGYSIPTFLPFIVINNNALIMDNQTNKIGSVKRYTSIFILLLVLTLVSAGLSTINLGNVGTLLTLSLAILTAIIVLTSFMKIKIDSTFAKLLLAGILALALLVFFVATIG